MADWKSKIEDIKFEIKTGDGVKYYPLWVDAVKNVKFNTEGFDFIGVEGTYVERKTRSGNQYPLTFYFQGENCIDEADNFDKSSRDRRPWTIKHPFFGTIKVQPLSFTYDKSKYNVVKITGTVWETISKKYPQSTSSPSDEVQGLKVIIAGRSALTLTKSIIPVTTENVQPSIDASALTGEKYKLLVQTGTDAAELRNRLRLASAAAQNILSDVSNYIHQATALINFPFLILQTIKVKINVIIEGIEGLFDIFLKDNNNEKDKELYEVQSALLLTELASNIVAGEYETVDDVLSAIDRVDYIYNDVLTKMDEAGHIPNADLATSVDLIINTSIASLFDIAFNQKQKRSVIIPEDTNAILLAHKYYGAGDDNLNDFFTKNNIGASEYLQVKKGREIIYFV